MADEKPASDNQPEKKGAEMTEKTKEVPSQKEPQDTLSSDSLASAPDALEQPQKSAEPDTPSSHGESAPDKEETPSAVQDQSFIQQAKDFLQQYKPEISLAILLLYVLTLAIATIIEILDH